MGAKEGNVNTTRTRVKQRYGHVTSAQWVHCWLRSKLGLRPIYSFTHLDVSSFAHASCGRAISLVQRLMIWKSATSFNHNSCSRMVIASICFLYKSNMTTGTMAWVWMKNCATRDIQRYYRVAIASFKQWVSYWFCQTSKSNLGRRLLNVDQQPTMCGFASAGTRAI